MSRSEDWNTKKEIKRKFKETSDPSSGAGPILYVENGKRYSDDSEAHMCVYGRTGTGKSQCCSLVFMREIFSKGESLVMVNSKEEGYRKNACYIPDDYPVFCVDLRKPCESPTKWNLFKAAYRFFKSPYTGDKDIASSMINGIWNNVYSYDGVPDDFWTDSAANYAKGLTYGLFETAPENKINFNSVAVMMEQSEAKFGNETYLKVFYDMLPKDSLARRNLSVYVSAPNETRASIHSVAASGIEVFSRSRGLMEMLSEDTLNITELDIDRPFALFIIIPDETDAYDSLAGILVSQVSQQLIRMAEERGGRLPIRVNMILEELGSVGKSIPDLHKLMAAGRSRNIRLMLVLQSSDQLVDIYGKSKAKTINACIGITIGFATNCWETLSEWAQRCGEKQVERNGHIVKEPLISAAQLAAMPTGTALVMVRNQYKFITHLPFYNELYDNSDWRPPERASMPVESKLEPFDFIEMVKESKRKKLLSLMNNKSDENNEENDEI